LRWCVKYEYSYDEAGNPTQVVYYDYYDYYEESGTEDYQYENNGYYHYENTYDEEGNLIYYVMYDDNGNLKKEWEQDIFGNGIVVRDYYYTYTYEYQYVGE
jgi:hypothetical protein